jgi:hypothetical protein
MKKTIYTAILFLIFGMVATSCKKEDEPKSFPTENPLELFHTNAGFTTVTNFINSGSFEFGLVFSPNVKGKINAITVKLPDTNASLKVTIWDYSEKTVLRTEIVNVATANTLTTKAITEINLEKDKKYMITMNSNDWYKKNKADNSDAAYPITAGNIKFHEYRWLGTSNQTFPTNIDLDYNAGDLSFDFQQTE